jgi:uncharacterized membrane protein YhiD involved in acid resistance
MVGAIGMAAGFGFYLHAVVMTGFALLVIAIFGAFSRWLQGGAGKVDAQPHEVRVRPEPADRGV